MDSLKYLYISHSTVSVFFFPLKLRRGQDADMKSVPMEKSPRLTTEQFLGRKSKNTGVYNSAMFYIDICDYFLQKITLFLFGCLSPKQRPRWMAQPCPLLLPLFRGQTAASLCCSASLGVKLQNPWVSVFELFGLSLLPPRKLAVVPHLLRASNDLLHYVIAVLDRALS